jgi:hypothetical protein
VRKTDVRPTRFPLPRCRAPNLRGQSVSARGSVFTLQVPTLFGNNDFPGCIRFRTSVSRYQAFLEVRLPANCMMLRATLLALHGRSRRGNRVATTSHWYRGRFLVSQRFRFGLLAAFVYGRLSLQLTRQLIGIWPNPAGVSARGWPPFGTWLS